VPPEWSVESETVALPGEAAPQFVWTFRRREVVRRPARILFVIHGFGEHGGRYAHFPHFLQNAVDAVVVPDLRGHGRSEGIRGHAESFEQFPEDAQQVLGAIIQRETQRYGRIELHLFGHSMGGHVLLRLLRRLKGVAVASATASAPFLGIYGKPPFVKVLAARLLSNVWGSLQLSTQLDASKISRDPAVVKVYREDRLVHDLMTPRMFTSMTAAMADTLRQEKLADEGQGPPLLFQVPLKDQIVDHETSLRYFEKVQAPGKQLKTYADSYHEAMNDLDKESFFADLRAWIEEHAQR
jgi:alpha-beta hydrolase superfamily lysophospholipase